jgi:hypothetical protein
MKKKPGTAPPAELPLKNLQLEHANNNQRIDMIYVNSQQPAQVKVGHWNEFASSRLSVIHFRNTIWPFSWWK